MSAVPNLPEDIPLAAPNGVADGATNGASAASFKLHDTPIDSARRLKVIVIGAGYSGIYLGIRIPERLRNVELVIYDKNAGLGGTWYENKLRMRRTLYPPPDLYILSTLSLTTEPAHSYQYSFEPNPNWSSLYAPAPEIQAYLANTAKKFSADRFIKLSHEITECRWDDATAKWNVQVKNLVTGEIIQDQADVLISARGNLNTAKWPNIEGLNTFKGEVMHSAKWNDKYDFTNKRIGVIGGGSSSIQIVPSLQRLPNTHVTSFARSKTWISPPFGQQLWDKYSFKGFTIPASLRERFISEPEYYEAFRRAVEEDGNGIHAVTMIGTPIQQGAKKVFEEHMKERLKDVPEIYEALLPTFSPGCRRLTPGPGYLEALSQPNVSFVTSPITHMTSDAAHTADGQTHTIDALVCATGFHASTAPPFPLYGSASLPLSTKWESRATNYFSHSIAGFPNLFTMLGPNASIGSGSLTTMIESVGDYAVKMIRKIQKDGIAKMEVKQEREDDFVEIVDAYFKGTVFGENCMSWYKNAAEGTKGEITGLWPGSCLHCIEAMRSPRWEDFEYVYLDELGAGGEDAVGGGGVLGGAGKKKTKRANRLAWLGNGWTVGGLEGKHLAWYLRDEFQDRPVAPRPEEKERFDVRPFSY
ncbi:FAD/NAD(P)-binding domain-containing protein [Massarina eburnea CBS 473.64]|uniref:FAD/NAD(P)-binding domain-containing protein n=1 Tax=Massarina eburnea CBS 473.64 TaxID=1395130 RepID=A0A6A6RYS7_9PLEO|nr:FAD/NAD(P)-binding domain-containing protein [Massarina eburnea CBS 473.64]